MFTDPEVIRYVGDLLDDATIRAGVPDSIRRAAEGWIGIWCVSSKETGEKLEKAISDFKVGFKA